MKTFRKNLREINNNTYTLSHISHANFLPCPWVAKCCLRSELVAKDLSQLSHLKGLTLLWTRSTWVFILYIRRKVWLQCGHVALTSVSLAGGGLFLMGVAFLGGTLLTFSFSWSSKCFCKACSLTNSRTQFGHLWLSGTGCDIIGLLLISCTFSLKKPVWK